jgi:hypothetical protein
MHTQGKSSLTHRSAHSLLCTYASPNGSRTVTMPSDSRPESGPSTQPTKERNQEKSKVRASTSATVRRGGTTARQASQAEQQPASKPRKRGSSAGKEQHLRERAKQHKAKPVTHRGRPASRTAGTRARRDRPLPAPPTMMMRRRPAAHAKSPVRAHDLSGADGRRSHSSCSNSSAQDGKQACRANSNQ